MDLRVAASVGLSLLLLGAFLLVFRPHEVWHNLPSVDPFVFSLAVLAVLLAVAAWAEGLRTLLANETRISRWRLFVAYNVGSFGKQVLPMGNAGGPALVAYAVQRETGQRYDETLAVVTIVEFLNLLAVVSLATAGVGYLLVFEPSIPNVWTLAVGLGAVVGLVVAVGVLVVYRRALVERCLLGVAALLERSLDGRLPAVGRRFARERVSDGLRRYYETVDRVGSDRRRLLSVFGWELLGWVCFSLPLFTGALAIGEALPLALVVFVVPVSSIAMPFPLPGGLGAVEWALTGTLITLTTVDPGVAATIVVLYRLCSYWLLLVLGGLATVYSVSGIRDLPTDLPEIEP